MKNKYLISMPIFKNDRGFNHPTILVLALNKQDAINIVKHLKPNDNIGDIKIVNY